MMPRLRALAPYLLVLAVAVVLTWYALHFDFTPRADRPGPDVWPRTILVLLIVTCVLRMVALLRRAPHADPVSLEDVVDNALLEKEREGAPAQRYSWLLVTGIALTIAYVALLGTLGFFVDTVLFVAALIRTGRYRRWPVIVAVAFSGALAFMFVFMRIVYLSLPIGRPPFSSVSLALMQMMGIR